MSNKHGFGYIPDLPDFRDHCFVAKPHLIAALPQKIDVRNASSVPVDQGELGSCTGNAIAACDYFVQVKEGHKKAALPSRLAIYYGERVIENSVKQDAGAMIRDGFKVLANTGAAPEKLWPYNVAKFTRKPTKHYFDTAVRHKAIEYRRLNNKSLEELKSCLAEGYPFVFGFTVYDSFESAEVGRTGVVPMPDKSESVLGGHAVLCVGYDDADSRFLVQNSWGTDWGGGGFFTIPYDYVTDSNLADDFWCMTRVK